MKKVLFILLFIGIALLFLGIHLFKQDQIEKPTPTLITVYITGGVLMEGKYEVSKETTLKQLIDYATLKHSADISALNLNQTLTHNKTYYIPIDHQIEKININTATKEELTKIVHIGPTTAQNIIDYRIKYGPFKSISDIQKVFGIGAITYEKIRDYITV